MALCGGWCTHPEDDHYEAAGKVYCRGCGSEPCTPTWRPRTGRIDEDLRRMEA